MKKTYYIVFVRLIEPTRLEVCQNKLVSLIVPDKQMTDNMASAENVVLLVCLCVGLVSTVDSFCPSKFSILETNVINLRQKSIQTPR